MKKDFSRKASSTDVCPTEKGPAPDHRAGHPTVLGNIYYPGLSKQVTQEIKYIFQQTAIIVEPQIYPFTYCCVFSILEVRKLVRRDQGKAAPTHIR